MVLEVCSVCGLPKDLCVCGEIRKGEVKRIKVSTAKAKFGKFMTVISGVEKEDLKSVFKELKRKLACGGAIKKDQIFLQGDHKRKIKDFLVKIGYKEENIEIE